MEQENGVMQVQGRLRKQVTFAGAAQTKVGKPGVDVGRKVIGTAGPSHESRTSAGDVGCEAGL